MSSRPYSTQQSTTACEPRGNAALSGAVVVVEAALDSGSLSTARAAGSRGAGQVLAVPGAPWDPGAAGCNDLIRDGATLVRGLDDVLEALGPTAGRAWPTGAGGGVRPTDADGDACAAATGGASPTGGGALLPGRPWPASASRAARRVLGALADGRVMGVARLAAATGLAPTLVAAALLELELAGFARRSVAGVEAVALPFPPASRGPPAAP